MERVFHFAVVRCVSSYNRRATYAFRLVLLAAFVFVRSASAEIILDQENYIDPLSGLGHLSYYLDYPGDHLAQTFTVRHSGILTGLGIQVSLIVPDRFLYDPPIDDLHISVVRVDSNGFALINDVLAKGTIHRIGLPVANRPGPMAVVDVSSWNARVSAGDRLAIAFASEQTDNSGPERAANYLWFRSVLDVHPGGRFSVYSPRAYGATPLWDFRVGPEVVTSDAGFRVYIDTVPEPGSLALALAGLTALAVRSRLSWFGATHARPAKNAS